MSNKKKLTKLVDKMRSNGEWDWLYTVVTDIVLDDAKNGLCENKYDRNTLWRFIEMYGRNEQRVEAARVLK